MPRALTEQEKCILCEHLLEKGKDVVLAQGIQKVSVDDIARAAGIAKGSFYQHFESKESYLHELIWYMHQQLFTQAKELIAAETDIQTKFRDFFLRLFYLPEMGFFLQHAHHDIIKTYVDYVPKHGEKSFAQLEEEGYKRLLLLVGADIETVKPGVVHNYLHTLYMMKSSDLMIKVDLEETFEYLVDGLMGYIFGGAV